MELTSLVSSLDYTTDILSSLRTPKKMRFFEPKQHHLSHQSRRSNITEYEYLSILHCLILLAQP
jgi:hypothetical protein